MVSGWQQLSSQVLEKGQGIQAPTPASLALTVCIRWILDAEH